LQQVGDRLKTAILPVGAVESHGSHLALGTDSFLVEGVLKVLRDRHAEEDEVRRAVVLPTLSIGASTEHSSFCGTLTVSDSTLIDLWFQVCESVHRSGLRRLLVLNGHGGQTQNVEILCRRLRFELKMFAVGLNLQRAWNANELFRESLLKYDIHAGAIETSAMMYLMPEHVHNEKLTDCKSAFLESPICPYGDDVMFGWKTEDLNASGVVGDPTQASTEAGESLINDAVYKLMNTIEFTNNSKEPS